jgi:HAD superfamily hydrolase (TIGR01509 family)
MRTATPIRAVLFDCDGTLVDSEPIWLATMRDAIAALPEGPSITLQFSDIEGQSMARSLEIVEERRGCPLPPAFEVQVRAEMARRFETDLCEIPGATALLRDLQVPCCVASNGPRSKIELLLRLSGLDAFVPASRVFSAVELGRYKPDPALFLHAAAAMGVAPADCAVVEDSTAGIEAGLRAGMVVFAYLPHAPLRPEHVGRVHRLTHLSELLDQPWNWSA